MGRKRRKPVNEDDDEEGENDEGDLPMQFYASDRERLDLCFRSLLVIVSYLVANNARWNAGTNEGGRNGEPAQSLTAQDTGTGPGAMDEFDYTGDESDTIDHATKCTEPPLPVNSVYVTILLIGG